MMMIEQNKGESLKTCFREAETGRIPEKSPFFFSPIVQNMILRRNLQDN